MLAPEKVELGVLSTITSKEDLAKVLRAGVTESTFLVYGEVFAYLLEYSKQYGEMPRVKDVEGTYEGLKLESGGKLEFFVDELLCQATVRRASAAIVDRFGRDGDLLNADPQESVRLLGEDLRKLQRSDVSHFSYLDRDAMVRLGWLEERRAAAEAGTPIGIRTGLRVFDDALQGWQSGETIYVIGPKGVGKSYFLMYIACVAYQAGNKILFLSPEMSREECAMRFDVVMGKLCDVELSHHSLTTGKWEDTALYQQWLERVSQREEFICRDSADVGGDFTLANMLAFQEEHRPDMLVLDGLQLVSGNEKGGGWEVIKKAAYGLKASAQFYGNVHIWSGQVDKEGMRNPTEPAWGGESAAYGKAAVEAANRLITMGTVAGDKNKRAFRVPNNRGGQTYDIKRRLIFDVDKGDIREILVEAPVAFEGEGQPF